MTNLFFCLDVMGVVMGVLGFGHVNLRAERSLLDQMLQFYTEVIGLTLGPRPPFARFGYWLYQGQHDLIHLIEASPEEQRLVHVKTTIDHFAFVCCDRLAYEQKLQQLGLSFQTAVVPQTHQYQIVLQDPAGNRVELNFAHQ